MKSSGKHCIGDTSSHEAVICSRRTDNHKQQVQAAGVSIPIHKLIPAMLRTDYTVRVHRIVLLFCVPSNLLEHKHTIHLKL